jgi:hypothetical protein
MLQRIFIMLVFVYYYDQNNVKGVTAFFIIASYTLLASKINPYENDYVKRVDIISGALQLSTI